MKHFLLFAFSLFLCAACTSSKPAATSAETSPERAQRGAQRGGGFSGDPAERLDRQMQALDERLDLTDEQSTKIRSILEESFQGMADLRASFRDADNPDVGRQAMQAMLAAADVAIEAELTESQIPEFRKMREEQRQRRGRDRGRN